MASDGSIPETINPVIIPGKLTRPTVFVRSIGGVIPVRMLSRKIELEACLGVAPRQFFQVFLAYDL